MTQLKANLDIKSQEESKRHQKDSSTVKRATAHLDSRSIKLLRSTDRNTSRSSLTRQTIPWVYFAEVTELPARLWILYYKQHGCTQCLNRSIHNCHSGFLYIFTCRERKNIQDTPELKQPGLRCSSPEHIHTWLKNCPSYLHRKTSVTDWANSSSSNWKHPLQNQEQSSEWFTSISSYRPSWDYCFHWKHYIYYK